MGISTGYGRAITSGSVFAFDTADVINSYKGEPTTNYQIDWSPWTVGGINTDVTGTSDQGPVKNAKTWKFEKIGGSNQWNGWESTYGGIWTGNSGDIWTTSYWYKTSAPAGLTAFGIGNFYLSDWSRPYNASVLANSNGIIADGQWHYNYTTTQLNENYSNAIIVDGPSWGYSTQTGTLYINGLQWEKKSHPTPFAGFTRSANEGLLPVAGNSTIDLTNMSFDSNAQLTFDGTNDYASVTLPSSINVYCLEMVWYNNNAIPNNDTVIGGPSTYQTPIEFNGNGQGVHLGAWTGGFTNEAIHIWGSGGATANQVYAGVGYHHVVFNWNGTTYDIWVDGVNTVTQYLSGYNYAQLITATSIKLGNDVSGYCFNGQIPVTKIYNRALSEGEVKQNYNKYKTRFKLS
jgi:hypothetical protein